MAAIDELIAQVENPDLRERLTLELSRMRKEKKFGLVFEEHPPESTPLYGLPLKPGSCAMLKSGGAGEMYRVLELKDGKALCLRLSDAAKTEFDVKELVRAARFGEPLYPCLKAAGSISAAPDSDLWHTLIEADNRHALRLLGYMYAGKVDCIYIDPPYNNGARDRKYTNSYAGSADRDRHSKWLSMMRERLEAAKKLLSPSGCIFISIDDEEACSLKLLCDEIFGNGSFAAQIPWRKRTTKSDVPFGISQDYESILCYANKAYKAAAEGKERTYYETPDFPNRPWRFHDLTTQRTISERPNSDFTIINPKNGKAYPVNPLRCWAVTKETFASYYARGRIIFPGDYGFLKISKPVLRYWQADDVKKRGSARTLTAASTFLPPELVGMTRDGTKELTALFGDKRFAFPKPLGLIKHLIAISTARKPGALILDFFAGSGTTLHAVNLLNAEDGGRRRCVMVTNNEVSEREAKALTALGYRPGDEQWERLGVARYVAWPRTVCSIEGRDANGNPLKGRYAGSKRRMSAGFAANCAYFRLAFVDKAAVKPERQFQEILPLLWMKAGAAGPCPKLGCAALPAALFFPKNRFAVLLETKAFPEFKADLAARPEIESIFIVTDDEAEYGAIRGGLPTKRAYRLCRDFLDNFKLTSSPA